MINALGFLSVPTGTLECVNGLCVSQKDGTGCPKIHVTVGGFDAGESTIDLCYHRDKPPALPIKMKNGLTVCVLHLSQIIINTGT
jgi:hypothetical protein